MNKLSLHLLVLLSSALVSLDVRGQPAAKALSHQDMAAEKAEHAWLSTTDGKDLAFYVSEKSGTAHGGVLIVPHDGAHPAISATIKTLRHSLAEHHWHTLALDISGHSPDTIQQLISAGVALLNEKGVFNIAILGQGQGAAHALQYVAALPPTEEGQIQQIRALLMLNAKNTVPGLEENVMAPLGQMKLPVLDAYQSNDYAARQQAVKRRRYTDSQHSTYQQMRLPTVVVMQRSREEDRLSKRIRGWLDKNVAGFMVDRQDR